ncbi:MAG: Ig-like domain-containing protein [Myxococcales bacterium]
MASYPADGQGTNAEPDADVDCNQPTPDCPVPTNLSIELRFDRFLLPMAGVGAGFALYTGSPGNSVGLRAEYDLIERVVVLRPTRALQPNALYTAELQLQPDPKVGFWAFDRAPLEPGPVPLRFSFTTGKGPSAKSLPAPAVHDTCDTLAEGPLATCAGCHSTTPADEGGAKQFPPMGLDLSTTSGLYYTALGRVAHQTETADSIALMGVETPVRFGVQMNIVDPGNPATSYLMYKLLQKPDNFQRLDPKAACPIAYHSPVAEGGCAAPEPEEIARVREWFVHGDPMPKDGRSAEGRVLPASTDYENLRRIAAWINAGAECPLPPQTPP